MHECNFPDPDAEFAEQTGHSWTSAVAEVAKGRTSAGWSWFTSIRWPRPADPVGLPTARAIFPKTDLGHDRLMLEF